MRIRWVANTIISTASWASMATFRWRCAFLYEPLRRYYHSDVLSRPTGCVPADTHPLDSRIRIGGGILPDYPNQGTRQPKVR
jgi:hypothetical protein